MDHTNIILKANHQHMPLSAVLETLNGKLMHDQGSYYPQLEAQPGKKYIRLVKREINRETGKMVEFNGQPTGSAYCFLDYQGNIFKCASFKIPAKHIRGSVFDPDCSFGKGLGPYGASHLR